MNVLNFNDANIGFHWCKEIVVLVQGKDFTFVLLKHFNFAAQWHHWWKSFYRCREIILLMQENQSTYAGKLFHWYGNFFLMLGKYATYAGKLSNWYWRWFHWCREMIPITKENVFTQFREMILSMQGNAFIYGRKLFTDSLNE